MNRPLVLIGCFLALLLSNGCSSFITRLAVRSFGRIGAPIDPAPHMITMPVLPNAGLAVGWVGHATVLLQMDDKLILTDPFLTNTVGMLVRRFVKPGLDPSILTSIDYTLVSHLHFDHFNYASLEMIPKNGALVLPPGGLPYTPNFGFREIKELEWWESFTEDGMTITAVPVQHFSGRYGFDNAWMQNTGFTGYIIQYHGYTVFFGGDTGYNPELFKNLGARYHIDLAILPIAPGGPNGLGSRIHANARGALQIFKDLGARYMMPIHYGTLYYGFDSSRTEAIDMLRTLVAQDSLSNRLIDPGVGEQRVVIPLSRIQSTN
jgi:N-acyl-phosphatidylethanolamine-hydrolysing phospholipase D